MNARKITEKLLTSAGIQINGSDPADIQIFDNRTYQRVLSAGSLGLGEAYMEGWWDCERLDALICKLLTADLEKTVSNRLGQLLIAVGDHLFNRQSRRRSLEVAEVHYNLGNHLFEYMLGKSMMYSCGYWANAFTLEKAQEQKLDLICRKLKLHPGLRVLDIGCGWGGFAAYAASKYGVEVTGITISEEQAEVARQRCAEMPVNIILEDYRDLRGEYDRIASIGMFEHVGVKNYPVFMQKVKDLLRDDGIFLLHTIGSKDESPVDPWIHRYIFPNGHIPSPAQISAAFQNHFYLQDWHCFGKDYDRTLMAWLNRFKQNWPKLRSQYGDRFYRMWVYYLSVCAASFRANKNSLWQLVLTKSTYQPNYRSVR